MIRIADLSVVAAFHMPFGLKVNVKVKGSSLNAFLRSSLYDMAIWLKYRLRCKEEPYLTMWYDTLAYDSIFPAEQFPTMLSISTYPYMGHCLNTKHALRSFRK